jgi:chorismate dehydratase
LANLKLGFINYSNSYPFFLALEKDPIHGVELKTQIPGRLNQMLYQKELHASAVSSYEYLLHQDQYHLLPEWCINSRGAVKSVLLFSKCPLDDLSGKKVLLSNHSATSVNLLHLIFEHRGIKPASCSPYDGSENALLNCDAVLLIGDPALKFEDPNFPHVLDLAEAWQAQSACPIVFAVQAIRREAWPTYQTEISMVLERFREVTSRLKNEGITPYLEDMTRAFPDLSCDFETYFKCLDFEFSSDCVDGLTRYAEDLYRIDRLPLPPLQISPLDI